MNVIKKVLSAIWKVIKLILRVGLYILSGLFWFIAILFKWQAKESERIAASNKAYNEDYANREWERSLNRKNGIGSNMRNSDWEDW